MQKINKKTSTKTRSCCVPQCSSCSTDDVCFYFFPIDKKLRKIWTDILKIEQPINSSMHVCNKHFTKDDITRKGMKYIFNMITLFNFDPECQKMQIH